jgi:FkbM family methyltransferase
MRQRLLGLGLRLWLEARGRRLANHEPEIRLLPCLADPRRAALDVGSNRGLYTTHLRRCARAVHAFEPLPHLARRIALAYPDVVVHPMALSDGQGLAQLRVPGRNYSWATIEGTNTWSGSSHVVTTVRVPMDTLDSLGLRDVGFMKIDVEGHELAVLRGAEATLQREGPTLLIEIEDRHAPDALARVSAWLHERGYQGFFVDGGHIIGVSALDKQRDQDPANVTRRGKVGRYINNFVFLPPAPSGRPPADRLARLRQAAGAPL